MYKNKSSIERFDIHFESKVKNQLLHTLRFVPRKNEDDYINVVRDSGCWSYLGKAFGEQKLSLDSGCLSTVGTPIHEFMHAIGEFYNSIINTLSMF